jgi:hypothetical protein
LVIAAVIGALALVVAAAALLIGQLQDEEAAPPQAEQVDTPAVTNEEAVGSTETEPGGEEDSEVDSAAPTSYENYMPSDSEYAYSAELPAGNGWSEPTESLPTGGGLLRTTVRGPEGSVLIVDRTPDEVPQLGGGFDSTREVPQPNFGTATEYVFDQSEAIPECNGNPCVDYLIEDGAGGGWGVLAGGPDQAIATEVAANVAKSIDE